MKILKYLNSDSNVAYADFYRKSRGLRKTEKISKNLILNYIELSYKGNTSKMK